MRLAGGGGEGSVREGSKDCEQAGGDRRRKVLESAKLNEEKSKSFN